MIPKRLCGEPEAMSHVDIEDVERVLSADYREAGSADKTVQKLKELLDGLKKE